MDNLAPTCYECNNWRGDADYKETMASAQSWMKETGLAAAGSDNTKPVVPLGTWVTAKTLGYAADPTSSETEMPAEIPLEEVSGKLDGFYVGTFDYFKYIVAGYDVDETTIKVTPEVEHEGEDPPELVE